MLFFNQLAGESKPIINLLTRLLPLLAPVAFIPALFGTGFPRFLTPVTFIPALFDTAYTFFYFFFRTGHQFGAFTSS